MENSGGFSWSTKRLLPLPSKVMNPSKSCAQVVRQINTEEETFEIIYQSPSIPRDILYPHSSKTKDKPKPTVVHPVSSNGVNSNKEDDEEIIILTQSKPNQTTKPPPTCKAVKPTSYSVYLDDDCENIGPKNKKKKVTKLAEFLVPLIYFQFLVTVQIILGHQLID